MRGGLGAMWVFGMVPEVQNYIEQVLVDGIYLD